jgi:predicted phosphate transport protein (TIGR00153 family)
MGEVQSCIASLQKLVGASFAADWQSADALAQEINSSKQDADEIKRDIHMHLPRSVFLPVARTDLLELVSIQNQIGYNRKQVAQLLLLRKRSFPGDLGPAVAGLCSATLKVSESALATVNELDELIANSFKGREAGFVEKLIDQLQEMEAQSEEGKSAIQGQLLQLEDSLNPVDVIFHYKLTDLLADIAHSARKAGSQLLMFMAR